MKQYHKGGEIYEARYQGHCSFQPRIRRTIRKGLHQSDREPGTRIKEGYRLKVGREDKHEVHNKPGVDDRPVGSSCQPGMYAVSDPDGSEKLPDLVYSHCTVADRKVMAMGEGERR